MILTTDIDSNIKIKKIDDLCSVPQIVYVTKFDEDSTKKFNDDIIKALDTKQPIIPIVIDSYGGYVDSLIHMMDMISSIKVPVATICEGKAMSCGAVLLSAGKEGYRFMGKNARVMIHEVSKGIHGKNSEIKADAKETDRLNRLIIQMMAKNVGKPENYFLDFIHEKSHADWYLTAEEAKEHNLINIIGIPEFRIKISYDTNFVIG